MRVATLSSVLMALPLGDQVVSSSPTDESEVTTRNVKTVSNVRIFRNGSATALVELGSTSAQFSCDSLVYGLTHDDCNYMSSIGMAAQGRNERSNNGVIWIGSDGPNTFNFINAFDGPIIIVVWHNPVGDHESSFMNVRQAMVTYSLPSRGSAVQISVANGIPGGWAAIYNRDTALTQYGQIDNTWGEFTSGTYATVDVSRLVNMQGNAMSIQTFNNNEDNGDARCMSDMQTCVFICKNVAARTCGESGTYDLINCSGPDRTYAIDGTGNPTGGCQGWSTNGHLEVVLS
ncbi:uncharacterized protein CTHT_0000510 [Thermochaetoides thermophila DSM 1495]|uniref:Uncharacterized protein n=1 Tax=Chaetomium thermophilum (strain DSM 1495 / CBS 144.50 / IMI 039719) TaxID=759272 RepID=G0RXV3_CHATD|nr:hypothetical protein CTHT_0000510 [Thermochaetoides thermophila DSM 1495]EGS24119.1 hypothetical protein CTHT_0000510 [Thermochaetoides thermophila DSM 1495]